MLRILCYFITIICKLCGEVYNDFIFSKLKLYRWYRIFLEGLKSIADSECSFSGTTSQTGENVNLVCV